MCISSRKGPSIIPDENEIKALGKFYTLNKQQVYTPCTNDSQVILPYTYM